ncbi:hypothetical protein [Nakamurella endophytica]|uniref:hypothetical protein n=1 Tax=Nakamurella endophytica TaxID=1748367 RepID=UPI0016667C29|nr:hypothetical protein [Nakamurella endophytica]
MATDPAPSTDLSPLVDALRAAAEVLRDAAEHADRAAARAAEGDAGGVADEAWTARGLALRAQQDLERAAETVDRRSGPAQPAAPRVEPPPSSASWS